MKQFCFLCGHGINGTQHFEKNANDIQYFEKNFVIYCSSSLNIYFYYDEFEDY